MIFFAAVHVCAFVRVETLASDSPREHTNNNNTNTTHTHIHTTKYAKSMSGTCDVNLLIIL